MQSCVYSNKVYSNLKASQNCKVSMKCQSCTHLQSCSMVVNGNSMIMYQKAETMNKFAVHTRTHKHTYAHRHGHLRTIDMHATWCVEILNSCVCAYVWVGGWFKRLLWSKEMRKIGIVDVPFNFKLHHAAALSKLSKSHAPLVYLRVCVRGII